MNRTYRVPFLLVGCSLLLLAAQARADQIGPDPTAAPVVSSLRLPLSGVTIYRPPNPNCVAAAEDVNLTGNVHVVSLLSADLSELSVLTNLDNTSGVGALDGAMFVGIGAFKVTRQPGPAGLPGEPLQVLATFTLMPTACGKQPGPTGLPVSLMLIFNADGTLSTDSTASVGAGITPGP